MGSRKEYKYIKKTDGRKNNGREKGSKNRSKLYATPSGVNQAKKDRVKIYGINAIKKAYGSEQEFWEFIAEESKTSFNHLKFLGEQIYGLSKDRVGDRPAPTQINIKNLFSGTQQLEESQQDEDIIDVTEEEDINGEPTEEE